MRLGLGVGVPMPAGVGGVPAAFSPLDLSPVLWLDASDTSTITEVGGAVSQWDDKSGNGNHVTQGTAAAQPTTGTRTQNSLNVLDFSNDWLQTAANVTVTQPYYIFTVSQWDTSGRTFPYLLSGRTTIEIIISLLSVDDLRYRGGTTSVTVETALTFDVPHLVGGLWDGASSEFFYDAAVSAQTVGSDSALLGTIGTAGAATTLATAQLDGWVGEIVVVEGTLTVGEVAAMKTYLNNKWSVY